MTTPDTLNAGRPTPGPWIAEFGSDGLRVVYMPDGSHFAGDKIVVARCDTSEHAHANVRFIVRACNENAPLRAALSKIATWMERQAERDEKQAAKSNQFVTLKEAYLADARNYRAMAKEARTALATPPGGDDGR